MTLAVELFANTAGQVLKRVLSALSITAVVVLLEAAGSSVLLVEADSQEDLLIVADIGKRSGPKFLPRVVDVIYACVLGIPHDAAICLDIVVHFLLYLVVLDDVSGGVALPILRVVVIEEVGVLILGAQANIRVDEHWECQVDFVIMSRQPLEHFGSYRHPWLAEQKLVAGCCRRG